MADSPSEIAGRLHDALAAGAHGEGLRALFTADAVVREHPNLLKPQGASASLEEMLADSTAGARLLSAQRFDLHEVVESADVAALRITWTGVMAADVGPFREGQVLTAHIAQFVRVADGRIASIQTYDCYEPFS